MSEKKEDYRLAAIMFTDICGFSRMMENNEQETLKLLKYHNELVGNLVGKYNGNVIKTIGDAFLVDFKNTTEAVSCAVEIQSELVHFNRNKQGDKLQLRIGIHLGDIWFFENDALGEGINIASRLQNLARPGRVCISKDVYNQILNKIDVEIVSLGHVKLKNITKEIYAYEIIPDFTDDYVVSPEPKTEEIRSESKSTGREKSNNSIKDDFHELKEELKREFKNIKSEFTGKTPNDEELKSSIISKVKVANKRIPLAQMQEFFPITEKKLVDTLDQLTAKGLLTKVEKDNGELEYGFGNFKKFWPKKRRPGVAEFITKRIRKLNKAIRGFRTHFSVYLSISGLCFGINMTTGADYPWFLHVIGGWGIGVMSNFFSIFNNKKYLKQLAHLPPDITEEQYKRVRKIQENESGFMAHLGAYISTNSYLFLINAMHLFDGDNFWWAPIVAMSWGMGLVPHFFAARSRRERLLEELRESGFDFEQRMRDVTPVKGKDEVVETTFTQTSPTPDSGSMPEEYRSIVEQAEKLKNSIITQIKDSPKLREKVDADIEELLNNYYSKLKQLIERDKEVTETINSISIEEVDAQIDKLRAKHDKSRSELLKKEYLKSIAQYERHKVSYEELENQKEIIYLRVSSALMSLKQLQLDLTSIEDIIGSEDDNSLKSLEARSAELNRYVTNLRQSYQELDIIES